MKRPRVLIIGAGFAGFHCARQLERKLEAHEAEVALVTPRNYLIYSPLLPQVAAGWLSPMAVAIPLRRTLRRTALVPGAVIGLDLDARACVVRTITGETRVERYDLLVLTPGNVTRTFNIPGLERHARGMKMLAEAVYLHDHVLEQVELADAASSEQERIERCTFVVVGGGYSGTETAAALHLASMRSLPRYPHLRPEHVRWILVDAAPQIMPELGAKLGQEAMSLLERKGIEVVLQTSVEEVTETTVRLSDGRTIPSRTLVWTAGAAANPLIDTLGLTTVRGRLAVTPELAVPGRADTFALGDAAAVPDLTAGQVAVCPPTAQHAERQGKAAARNVVATLRGEPLQPYRHLQQRPQVLRAAACGDRLGAQAGPCLEVAPLEVRRARVRLVSQAGELGRQGEQPLAYPHADGLEVLYFPGPVQALACHVQAAGNLQDPGVLVCGRMRAARHHRAHQADMEGQGDVHALESPRSPRPARTGPGPGLARRQRPGPAIPAPDRLRHRSPGRHPGPCHRRARRLVHLRRAADMAAAGGVPVRHLGRT